MSNWVEHAHILANNSPPGALGGVSSLSFDPFSELLWAGTGAGQVASHYGNGLQRYTSYPAHGTAGNPSPVKGLLVDERHVYSVGEGGIKCANRRGVGRWNVQTSEHAPSLALSSMCASPLTTSSDLIAGGATQMASTGAGGLGQDDVVLVVNRNSGSVVRKVSSESPLLHLRKSARLVCAGTGGGHVQLRDPRSLRVEHRLHAHPGGLIDMQADGNLIYSVGWTVRQGHPVAEPLIKVHDLRTLRALVPIPFAAPGGPALLAIHPKLSTTVVVAAPQGQFQVVDVGNPGEGRFYQLNSTSYMSSLAISPSADFLAFGEADGSVRLWASASDPSTASSLRFNPFASSAPEAPDLPEQPAFVNWTTETPLSSIGMPYYSDPLLSALDSDSFATDASPMFNPPGKVDPAVLSSMRTVDFVGYAALPRHLRGRRNVITGRGPGGVRAGAKGRAEDRRRVGFPLFRSEREKEAAKRAANGIADDEGGDAAAGGLLSPGAQLLLSESNKDAMPAYYRKVEIQYSKFGVEDFDFAFYNKTPYSGLETHIANSYANALLQALHYLRPFRTVAKAHILRPCGKDNCLLCEAGFLSRMLEDAKGANCQATNFLRAFGSLPQAAALGLMDKEDSPTSDTAYTNLIQSMNRFMLDTTSSESIESGIVSGTSTPGDRGHEASRRGLPLNQGGKAMMGWNPNVTDVLAGGGTSAESPQTAAAVAARRNPEGTDSRSLISRLFANGAVTKTTCGTCGNETTRESSSHVIDLVYPRKALSNEPATASDFASILRSSLVRETLSKATCRACHTPASPLRSRRVLPPNSRLPQALSVNAAVHTSEQLGYWLDGVSAPDSEHTRTYVPPKLGIDVQGEEVRSKGIWNDEEMTSFKGAAVYTLRAMIVQIQAEKDPPHLCAIIRVPEAEEKGKAEGEPRKSPWYLFNDFLVRNISEEEALGFPNTWKIPAVLFFEREDAQVIDFSTLPTEPDRGILCQDLSISWNRDPARIRHSVLKPEEMPQPGTLVSIDAEFVALNQEELEIRSDGTRSVIRPSRLTLARVSVLRGEGPDEGKPFIDDHIYTREPIVDYLTQFSGIMPGDLDPQTSKHTLVPLKVAYKKLRLLVDLGCVFIGHGLKKDFRIINIHIPPAQVIDTVDLYHSAAHPRKLALRFLAWFLLKQDIQAGTQSSDGHDSIEDASAAWRLYRLYEGFEKDGRLEDVMEDLYNEGRRVNWKPPSATTNANANASQSAPQTSTSTIPGTTPEQAPRVLSPTASSIPNVNVKVNVGATAGAGSGSGSGAGSNSGSGSNAGSNVTSPAPAHAGGLGLGLGLGGAAGAGSPQPPSASAAGPKSPFGSWHTAPPGPGPGSW